MSSIKGVAIVMIVAGALALAYGGFSYTKNTHEAHIGSLELSVKDKEHVNVPAWLGVGAIIIGAGLLFAPGKKPL
jgi:TRAP-type C4-dicarboxylate transport system permease small subunit